MNKYKTIAIVKKQLRHIIYYFDYLFKTRNH
ncbi:hypothetical protein SERP0031 [Staphylococcus epidermidis RP62A]|uniref:Uncharacterized protein n=1 Tax=Staphylococcus epidermidis (strain ATCC 35984 / DSM 28319 / BCRC 17069 / CCUG 31568 / BM 3577 / RP62A) TaxID=176279 RepID=Q5HS08_STAEQ|nr:hypothetical protein SERP0031 [Staphylococcus epidermidis RP62A]EES57851.1 hypothetical protein HMPREF0789_1608 [Staphylococcus epidermidis BCM-HMP0060]